MASFGKRAEKSDYKLSRAGKFDDLNGEVQKEIFMVNYDLLLMKKKGRVRVIMNVGPIPSKNMFLYLRRIVSGVDYWCSLREFSISFPDSNS